MSEGWSSRAATERGVGALLCGVAIGLMACSPAAQPAKPPAPSTPLGVVTREAAQSASAPSAAAAPPPTAVPVKSINVGIFNPGMSYLHHRIAQTQGYYRESGFDAELQVLPGTSLLAALVAGEIGFADSGGSAIRAAATGLPVRLVACHGVRPLYSVALAPGVQSAADLGDKGFAVNSTGDDTFIIARDLIRKYGGDPSAVQYAGLGTSAVRLAAVQSGRVGGGILSAAETIQAREAGLQILNTAEDLPLACNSGSVVTVAALAERPAEVRRLVAAVHRAVQFMHDRRADSIRILAEWQQLDERQAALAFDAASVSVSYSTEKGATQQAIENALEFAKQAGHVEPGVQLRDVADLSFMP